TLALDKKFGDEDDTFYAAFSAAFAQATFGVNLGAEQTLEVVVTPRVRYEFSDGLPPMDLELGEPISGVVMPPDGTLEITPFVYATTTFDNDTDMTLSPTAGFSTLEFSVAADFDGWRLIGLSECILCFDEELFTVNIDILNLGWNTMVFPEVELSPIRVTGSTDVQPRLSAASRAAMSMAIYNQTAPSQSNFNVISRGTSRMLLFGDRLFAGSEAVIKHQGRTECLPTSWINDNTLLVDVPNRFRLLPGVAKIWVESQFGISESIDMPIEYPVPRLDTVNPNLWSADPDMNVLPVAVIDGGSTIGNDTFIARRDYYIKMRDDLWNPSTVTGNPIYSTSPALSIPDGTGTFVSSTITVPDQGTISDVNVRLVVDHTYNGDLIVRLTHNGVTRTLVDRPGRTSSGFGFDNDGFSIWLDDQGAGGPIENLDSGGPAVVSPPSYVPNQSLSAFNGQSRTGTWTLEISDNAAQDTGALVGWSLEFTGGGPIGAQAYFPCFDFNQLPAFPGVFFDGMPMERYAQPVDSGIHNIRLAESDYDTPRAVQVVLCNPGPGGGASTPVTLTIAAPRPAITSIEPREVEPDTEDFDIIVRGPKHVPFWPEYEEPKYGNFNRDSQIRFNGTPLPTIFVGSAELRATVPAGLINGQERNHVVTVYTPDNGTSYFEELHDGSGNIVFQGLTPSGGESAGLLFVSRYQDPVIDVLSPDSTVMGNMAFAAGAQEYNLTVCGQYFRSTSQVLLGGEPRPTNFISSTMLEVRLSPEDVASPQFSYITVHNFNGAVSQPAEFLVTAPPPAPAGFGKNAPASRDATTRIER
ncbi:MAG: IPT/TIG domain-containing protein, partial [Phycisphaerales bacterium]|nr:IPT/TIG domain-containing protein [Phycisphaerales bacterium]